MTPNAAPTEALPPLPAPSFYVNVSKESPRTPAFDAEQMNDRWRAGFEAGRTILAGDAAADGVWVPREPTNEMYLAACAAYTDWHNRCLYPESYEEPLTKTSWTHIDVYLSMIAAAPQPTRVDKGEQDRGTQMTTLTPTPAQAVVLEALRMARDALDHYLHGGSTYRKPAVSAIAAIDDALAALVQPPEAPAAVELSRLAEDEHGWLIECDGKWPYLGSVAPLSWLTVHGKLSGYGEQEFNTTHDASQALRFSRREDAEAILRMHLGGHDRPEMRAGFTITEHMWALATMASTPAPQVPSEAARLVGGEAVQRCAVQDALYAKARAEWHDLWLINDRNFKTPNEWFLIGVEWAATQAAPTDAPGEQSRA